VDHDDGHCPPTAILTGCSNRRANIYEQLAARRARRAAEQAASPAPASSTFDSQAYKLQLAKQHRVRTVFLAISLVRLLTLLPKDRED